jgi:hypothetical protein
MESEFKKILAESKKTYKFKLGLAGALPENIKNELENALKKYDCLNLSKGRKTPIQERPLDFPKLQNEEVTYFDAELGYPTTPQVLQQYISLITKLPTSHVIARTDAQDIDATIDSKEESEKAKLESELEQADPKSQKQVGNQRVMELLKELEKARKESATPNTVAEIKTPKDSKEMSKEAEGNTSPFTKTGAK